MGGTLAVGERLSRKPLIRPAVEADVEALLAIENAVFPTDRLTRRQFRHAVRSPTILFLVAVLDRQPVGYVTVQHRRGAASGHLTSLAVARSAMGRGLGRALLAGAEAAAAQAGCRCLRLEVRPRNMRARHLYEAAGWRRIAKIEDYYEDGAPAYRYEKTLP